jgi:hypothetical protein
VRAKIAIVAFTMVTALGANARADVTRQQCVEAYDRAQILKKESKLREARETLLVCSNNACPAATRNDCVPWLAEVEASTPTVSFAVRDESGHDVVGARVVIDGTFDKDASEGRAVPIDPGNHTVRIETSDGRKAEDVFSARASEKNRLVTVALKAIEKPAVPPTTPPPEPEPEKRSLVLPIVLGGVGVLGIGAAFFFGFGAKSDAEDLRKSCAPNCKDSDLDPVHTKLLASDIGLGVGVVALAAAAYLLLSPPATVTPGAKGVAIRF